MLKKTLLIAIGVAAFSMTAPTTSNAATLGFDLSQQVTADANYEEVRFKGRRGGFRGRGFRGGFHGHKKFGHFKGKHHVKKYYGHSGKKFYKKY